MTSLERIVPEGINVVLSFCTYLQQLTKTIASVAHQVTNECPLPVRTCIRCIYMHVLKVKHFI